MIRAWTDGSSKGNPGPGGAGIVILLPNGDIKRIAEPLGKVTNNQAELLAVQKTLAVIAEYNCEPIVIHTDSQGVIGWLTGAWRVNANRELVSAIRKTMQEFTSISFVKVRGHSNDLHNKAADALANYAATRRHGL